MYSDLGFSQAETTAKSGIDPEEWVKDSQRQVRYTSTNLRDPFTLSTLPEVVEISEEPITGMPQLDVQGFVWGSSLPQAIINGKVCSVGDTIEGAKIIKIDQAGITILYYDKYYTLR